MADCREYDITGFAASGATLPVDFSAVADGEDAHLPDTVIDFVENAIIHDADTPLVAATGKLFGVVWTGLCAELIDGRPDAAGHGRR